MHTNLPAISTGIARVSPRKFMPLAQGIAVAVAVMFGATAANAAVVTWNPAGVGLAGPAFSFDKLGISDYARIHVFDTAGDFTETGFLNITTAHLGSTYVPAGLYSGASGYTLYIDFSATGNSTSPDFHTSGFGTFSALNYTLYGVSGKSIFSVAGATPTVTNSGVKKLLATGSLIDGNNALTVSAGSSPASKHSPGTGPGGTNPYSKISPSATLDINFVPNTAFAPFFSSPDDLTLLDFAAAFVNNFLDVTLIDPATVTINGGGGDATPTVVPEPVSIALLGVGLLGLGIVAKRRKPI